MVPKPTSLMALNSAAGSSPGTGVASRMRQAGQFPFSRPDWGLPHTGHRSESLVIVGITMFSALFLSGVGVTLQHARRAKCPRAKLRSHNSARSLRSRTWRSATRADFSGIWFLEFHSLSRLVPARDTAFLLPRLRARQWYARSRS